MPNPFFSILLPTKNRAEIVGDAIRSVLAQTDPDFEVIVSDNDDSPTATRDAVAVLQDPRIRHVRTSGTLAMHENWDFAFRQATGEYVLVLEDKMRLTPRALEHLRAALKPGIEAVSYPITFCPGPHPDLPDTPPRSRLQESRRVMSRLMDFNASAFDSFPKGLDTCARRSMLEQLRQSSPTGFLFSHICPDYAFGFLLLSHLDTFHRLDQPLAFIPNNWGWSGRYSNGQSSYRKDGMIRRFLASVPVSAGEITARVPVRSEFLWINLVLYDLQSKYRRPDHPAHPNWAAYHAFVLILLVIGRKLGADMSLERREWVRSMRQNSVGFALRVAVHLLRQGTAHTIRHLTFRCRSLRLSHDRKNPPPPGTR